MDYGLYSNTNYASYKETPNHATHSLPLKMLIKRAELTTTTGRDNHECQAIYK